MTSSSVSSSLNIVCLMRDKRLRAHLMPPATGGWFLARGGCSTFISKISEVVSISRANCSRMSLTLLTTCFWMAPLDLSRSINREGRMWVGWAIKPE